MTVDTLRGRVRALVLLIVGLFLVGRFFVSLGRHDGGAGEWALLAILTLICTAIAVRMARRA